jgi:hypothetical protein
MSRLDDLAQKIGGGGVAPPQEEALFETCPFLWEMLTMDKWADGSERLLPEMVISRVPGGYKITLKDDSLCIRKSVVAPTIEALWKALEDAIVRDDVPWENFKSYRNKKGPKVPEATKGGGQKKRK